MRDRWVIQVVIGAMLLGLTGCQLLAIPMALIEALLPWIMAFFQAAAPVAALGAAAVQADPPAPLPIEIQSPPAIERELAETESLPPLTAETVLAEARRTGARRVALIDLREVPREQLRPLLRRLRAQGARCQLADGRRVSESLAARQALASAITSAGLQLWQDRDGEPAEPAGFADWRTWLDRSVDPEPRR